MSLLKVEFTNQNKILEVEKGISVAKACELAEFSLNLVCGGKGTCGKCLVGIEQNGDVTKVLACKTYVEGDIKIFLTENDYTHKASILADDISGTVVKYSPQVKKVYKTKKELEPQHCGGFLSGIPLNAMRKFGGFAFDDDFSGATFTQYNGRTIDVQKGDTGSFLYGAAVDIGTTSVVTYIYDLISGELLQTYSALNEQISNGGDVISRIMYASESDSALHDMTRKISDTINKMLALGDSDIEGLKQNLYNIALCGNSTMQHLLMGLNPKGLGVSPFVSITVDGVECTGADTMLEVSDVCIINTLPLLGGFVGGDTTAVLLAVKEEDSNILMIDLGTNGEIAVGTIDDYATASTACGPALEGGNIECGMRATDGAIEKFCIKDGEILIKTINDKEPIGICGSGIIDIVAELLRAEIIDDTGRLIEKDEFEDEHSGSPLAQYLVKMGEYNNCFMLHDGENKVYISQKDIRQIQLAKSSIYAGCVALLKKQEIELENVDALVLAGAFGNYIDVDNALYMGLFPKVSREKINTIGNGAGKGVQLYLTSEYHRQKCERVLKNTRHYELATDLKCVEEYMMNMNFEV